MQDNSIIFQITEKDIQVEAMERIGRELTDDEMDIARKGIEWGLGDITLVSTYDAIFDGIMDK